MTDPALSDDPRVRDILNTLGEGVTLADRSGRIVFSNAAADRLLGVTASSAPPDEWAEHYGVFLPDRTTPFPVDQYPLVRALAGEGTSGVEMFVRNQNVPAGRLLTVTGHPMRASDGTITGATVVFSDITRLRDTERDLRATLQSREELSGFIVHDLKGPLTAVLALSDLLFMEPALSGEPRQMVAELKAAAWSMHRMVMDLLDVHVAESGGMALRLQAVRVAELLEKVRAVMAASTRTRGQALVIHEVTEEMEIWADPDLIDRVLFNLIDNCAKYGQQNGQIRVTADPSGSGPARLTVSDEGPGVPEELRDVIFEKFTRVERDRSGRTRDSRGVGLSFAKIVVDAHGGRIWVEDNEPKGARFCIELRTPELVQESVQESGG